MYVLGAGGQTPDPIQTRCCRQPSRCERHRKQSRQVPAASGAEERDCTIRWLALSYYIHLHMLSRLTSPLRRTAPSVMVCLFVSRRDDYEKIHAVGIGTLLVGGRPPCVVCSRATNQRHRSMISPSLSTYPTRFSQTKNKHTSRSNGKVLV